MSDLTREEVRAACEAVGWKWVETKYQAWAERDEDETLFLVTEDADDPTLDDVSCYECDAIALLVATGLEWVAGRIRSNIVAHPYWAEVLDDYPGLRQFGIDLPTAAVRAVNAWAKTRQET